MIKEYRLSFMIAVAMRVDRTPSGSRKAKNS